LDDNAGIETKSVEKVKKFKYGSKVVEFYTVSNNVILLTDGLLKAIGI
jgi:hypothetical protein